jgi:hypothetical protein
MREMRRYEVVITATLKRSRDEILYGDTHLYNIQFLGN